METVELLPSQMRIGEFPFANASGELTMTAGKRFGHTVLGAKVKC